MSFLKFNVNNKKRGTNNMPINNGSAFGYSRFYLGSGGYVNANIALQNSDIYSVIFQLSNDLADCKYTAVDAKTKKVLPRSQNVIDDPMPGVNAHAFWQGMFAQLLLDGNAYAYMHLNDNGVISWLEFLRPSQVEVMLTENCSELLYNVTFDDPEIGLVQNIPASNILHFRIASRNGGKTGSSPLLALQNEVAIHNAANATTQKALDASVDIPGVLTVHKSTLLSNSEKIGIAAKFDQQLHSKGPVVIDDSEAYQPLEIKTNVAQLLQATNWTSTNIAKCYGVSDAMLNGSGDQQSSIQMIASQYANALNRYATEIVSELNTKLKAEVHVNLRPAIDVTGDNFATVLAEIARSKAIAGNQLIAILQHSGYFGSDDFKVPAANFSNTEGGENDE